jgi:regulatory protein
VIVTRVERRPRSRLVDVFIDGEPALSVGAEVAVARDLRPGRALTEADVRAIKRAEARRRAIESGLRLLSYRPRSERELRDRLARKGFARDAVGAALARLRELGYLDDAAFASFWIESRQTYRPGARRLVAAELRQLGVGREVADEATAVISDEEAAYEAARRRLRALRGLEYRAFRERLGAFLTRRGFSYDVARRTIDRCWAEGGS